MCSARGLVQWPGPQANRGTGGTYSARHSDLRQSGRQYRFLIAVERFNSFRLLDLLQRLLHGYDVQGVCILNLNAAAVVVHGVVHGVRECVSGVTERGRDFLRD